MKHADTPVNSVAEVLSALHSQYDPSADTVWFRGHVDCAWTLSPSLYRSPYKLEHETTFLTRFKQNALPLLAHRPNTPWEWLFLMRHHGVPTRLLDWTESPLVALFFACDDLELHNSKDGHLWCMDPVAFNEQWGKSGTHRGEIPAFGLEAYLDDFEPEKIHLSRGITKPPAAAIASREAGRMTAQQSVFTVHHKKTEPIESYGDKLHVWRLVIPAASKRSIRRELAVLGVRRLSIFPDLDSVGKLASESIL